MTCRTNGARAAASPVCRRLFDLPQAADVADVPPERICRWIVARRLRAYRVVGGLRVDEVELADFLSSRQPAPRS